jgi:Arc/MetJ-type ribon-helix-helix transcriptional regulator
MITPILMPSKLVDSIEWLCDMGSYANRSVIARMAVRDLLKKVLHESNERVSIVPGYQDMKLDEKSSGIAARIKENVKEKSPFNKLTTLNIDQVYIDAIDSLVFDKTYVNRSDAIRTAIIAFVDREVDFLSKVISIGFDMKTARESR